MRVIARRRITLLDLLVLIAATAVGLVLLRVSMKGMEARPVARYSGALAASYITTIQTYTSCLMAPWSLALLGLNLRQPRASFRRIARGPGFVACVTATAGVALYLTVCLAQYSRGKLAFGPAAVSRITGTFHNQAALMVAGGWLALALGSRWRAETSWPGRGGLALGVGWIGLFLFGWLRILV
jgi:hypothetical protein